MRTLNVEPRRYRKSRGYVLLMVLGLLVLSTTLLVAVGTASARHALQARLEQNELQQRWGVISCRAAVIRREEQILVNREQDEHRAVAHYTTSVPLGDDLFTMIISDEQAKANVNGMIDQFGIESTGDRIRQAISGSGLLSKVKLRPALETDSPTTRPVGPAQVILGPGQIFDSVPPNHLIDPRHDAPMANITCWGPSTLNVMRANEQSMRLLLSPALTRIEISRLLRARDDVLQLPITSHGGHGTGPGNTDAVGSLLQKAQIDIGRRNRLPLTSRSACYSLWIIVNDHRKDLYFFTVRDESNRNNALVQTNVW